MRRAISCVLAAAVTTACAAVVQARTTVGIAPFTTTAGDEYQWMGPAIADALSLRVHQQNEINALTLRQINAALRQEGVDPAALAGNDAAFRLGRQVGADVLVTGTYTARWPDIEILVTLLAPETGKVLNSQMLTGDLEKLPELEAQIAKTLALQLGAEDPKVAVGAFGTKNLRAWMETTLGMEILNWQSLGPRAADPNAPLSLPPEALAKARDHLEKATKHDPDYGEAWAGLGVAQALSRQTSEAWRSFGKATALGFGHHPTAALGASFVRMREGRFEDAAEILKSAVARHPGFLHARGYLGELYNHLGRQREALAVWEAYSRIAPKQPWVLTQLGYTKSKLGDHIGAIADSIAAVDVLPDSPSLLIELASRYIDARKLAGAEDALLRALQLFPEEGRVYVRLGYVYLLQGKDDQAIPTSEKALQLTRFSDRRRDRGYAHLNLARAHGHKGDLDAAFEHLDLAKQHGIGSFREVEGDPALAKLRADPRFRKGGYTD